jgi:hypothetical protein
MARVGCAQLEQAVHDRARVGPDLRSTADDAEVIMRQSGGLSPITPIHEIVFLHPPPPLVSVDRFEAIEAEALELVRPTR